MTDHVRILLVEDDEDDYFLTADSLSQCKSPVFELVWAKTGEEAIEHLQTDTFDLCLLDTCWVRKMPWTCWKSLKACR